MKFWQTLVVLLIAGGVMSTAASETPAVMDGFPPSAESQVTKRINATGPTANGLSKISGSQQYGHGAACR